MKGNPATQSIAIAKLKLAFKENATSLNTKIIIPIENNKLNINPPCALKGQSISVILTSYSFLIYFYSSL